jgi:protein-tyrosine phosphatase
VSATGSGPARPFTILFVCSGNICRSPLAAQLLTAKLGDAADRFRVLSAGTIADEGAPMDETAAAQSRRLGADPSAHVATELTGRLIGEADLVLTAERSHRAAVAGALPRASRLTFTILQFTRVLAGLEDRDRLAGTGPAALVAAVAAGRGSVAPPADPADDDVEDPYRRSADVHEHVADVLDAATTEIAAALRASVADEEALA